MSTPVVKSSQALPVLLVTLLATLLAACGGTPAATVGPATIGASQAPGQPTASGAPQPSATPSVSDAPAGSFVPGPVSYRVVNLIGADDAVDVYVRTQGLVQAFLIQAGLEYGEVTELFGSPEPGTVVVTQAGATDATCVGSCPHFIASIGTGSGEGDVRTVVLYDGGTQELWHDPNPASVGVMGNALPPADPSIGQVFTVAVGLKNADFGLRLAFDGEDGCQVNLVSESVLVGGNQVGAFALGANSAAVTLHDNRDAECAEPAVGGPFDVSAAPGERIMLVLFGEPGSMEALVLEV